MQKEIKVHAATFNPNGLTIRELKTFLGNIPEYTDELGEENSVWIANEEGVSSPAVLVIRLNRYDVLLSVKDDDHA